MRRNISGPALDKVIVSTYPAVSVLHASVELHVCAFILPVLYFYLLYYCFYRWWLSVSSSRLMKPNKQKSTHTCNIGGLAE